MRDREGWTEPEKKIGDRIEKEGWKLRGQLDIDHHPTHHILLGSLGGIVCSS